MSVVATGASDHGPAMEGSLVDLPGHLDHFAGGALGGDFVFFVACRISPGSIVTERAIDAQSAANEIHCRDQFGGGDSLEYLNVLEGLLGAGLVIGGAGAKHYGEGDADWLRH